MSLIFVLHKSFSFAIIPKRPNVLLLKKMFFSIEEQQLSESVVMQQRCGLEVELHLHLHLIFGLSITTCFCLAFISLDLRSAHGYERECMEQRVNVCRFEPNPDSVKWDIPQPYKNHMVVGTVVLILKEKKKKNREGHKMFQERKQALWVSEEEFHVGE